MSVCVHFDKNLVFECCTAWYIRSNGCCYSASCISVNKIDLLLLKRKIPKRLNLCSCVRVHIRYIGIWIYANFTRVLSTSANLALMVCVVSILELNIASQPQCFDCRKLPFMTWMPRMHYAYRNRPTYCMPIIVLFRR